MSEVARHALALLLQRTENAKAKAPVDRLISLRFTAASFKPYLELPTHAEKQLCHDALQLAERAGAIAIGWNRRAGSGNQIDVITVADPSRLAEHMGVTPRWDQVVTAQRVLHDSIAQFPVLTEVIAHWRVGRKVRATGPTDANDWLLATQVVARCRQAGAVETAVRRLSAALFSDSKRIESLAPLIDVLLQGDLALPARDAEDIFDEIGLVKFAPIWLVSGAVSVQLQGVAASVRVHPPYTGFAPPAITAISLAESSTRVRVLSVENLTTFNELTSRCEQRDYAALLYTGGMPSPSWKRVYRLLLASLPADAEVVHWGDIDLGGFRIADHLAMCCHQMQRKLMLTAMTPELDVSMIASRKALSHAEIQAIRRICDRHGWYAEAAWVERYGVAIEQEALPWSP